MITNTVTNWIAAKGEAMIHPSAARRWALPGLISYIGAWLSQTMGAWLAFVFVHAYIVVPLLGTNTRHSTALSLFFLFAVELTKRMAWSALAVHALLGTSLRILALALALVLTVASVVSSVQGAKLILNNENKALIRLEQHYTLQKEKIFSSYAEKLENEVMPAIRVLEKKLVNRKWGLTEIESKHLSTLHARRDGIFKEQKLALAELAKQHTKAVQNANKDQTSNLWYTLSAAVFLEVLTIICLFYAKYCAICLARALKRNRRALTSNDNYMNDQAANFAMRYPAAYKTVNSILRGDTPPRTISDLYRTNRNKKGWPRSKTTLYRYIRQSGMDLGAASF